VREEVESQMKVPRPVMSNSNMGQSGHYKQTSLVCGVETIFQISQLRYLAQDETASGA
jgi:hypothetical protein